MNNNRFSFLSGPAVSAGISLYYTHIGAWMTLPGLRLLTPARRERLEQYRRREDKARCLAAGMLLRQLADGEPEKNPWGKPQFPAGPRFNLSHAGEYVVLAVSAMEVGVDVEEHRPYDPRVARRCFTEAELRWMKQQPDKTQAFYTLWTAKECIMKAAGYGFHMPPETFETDIEDARGYDADGRKWHLAWMPFPNHTVCAASLQSGFSLCPVECSVKELLAE